MASTSKTTPITTSTTGSKSTSTYSPITITSFHANPLTAIFTPPSDCVGVHLSVIDIIDKDLSCLPPNFSLSSTEYFSPGIACPSGYVTACSDTQGVKSITTVTCCPYRNDITLSCVNPANLYGIWATMFCTWMAPAVGTTVLVTASSGGTTSTITSTMKGPEGINAYGVRMVYESTDVALATTSTNSMAPGTSSTSLPSSGETGLSTGAIIAIAVVIPLVAIAVAIGCFLWMRRRKRRYNAVQNTIGSPIPGPSERSTPFQAHTELKPPTYGGVYDPAYSTHSSRPGAGQRTEHGHGRPAELGVDNPAVELPAT
ncbi:hypothetical protein GQ53DRAFT_742801 [Thozetella sp. PMI_491]|nr:hypothetical protein GQ53DRAFT_742801 [Thozetella sp. PMI_491]